MSKFSFRPEPVRALRAHAEAVAKEALARELAVAAEREAELDRADAALDHALACGCGGTVEALEARQAFVEACECRRRAASAAVQEQQERAEQRRAELEAAAAARAAVERLRDRRLAAFVAEELRAETAELGEIATGRAARTVQP